MTLEASERAWIDARWDWLERTLGGQVAREATAVVPDRDCFPDPYDASPESAALMFKRVQAFMGLDGVAVTLEFFENDDGAVDHGLGGPMSSAGPAGLFTRYGEERLVALAVGQLGDPTSLAATIAHELGHVALIGEGRITGEEPDQEPLTDLITVYLGLGVLTANSVVRDHTWSSGGWEGWSISRLGYLTQDEFAYALAKFAKHRGETDPAWAEHLTTDIRAPFRRYLKEPPPAEPSDPRTLEELMVWRGERMAELAEGPVRGVGDGRGNWILGLIPIVALALCLISATRAPAIPIHLINGTPHKGTVTVDGTAHALGPYERRRVEVKPGERRIAVEHPWDDSAYGLRLTAPDAKATFIVNIGGAAPLLIEAKEYGRPKSSEEEAFASAKLEFGRTRVRLTDIDFAFEPWPDMIRAPAELVNNPIRRRLTVHLGSPEAVLGAGLPPTALEDAARWLEHLALKDPTLQAQVDALSKGLRDLHKARLRARTNAAAAKTAKTR